MSKCQNVTFLLSEERLGMMKLNIIIRDDEAE